MTGSQAISIRITDHKTGRIEWTSAKKKDGDQQTTVWVTMGVDVLLEMWTWGVKTILEQLN